MKKKIKAKLNNFELFFLHPIQIGQTKQKKNKNKKEIKGTYYICMLT